MTRPVLIAALGIALLAGEAALAADLTQADLKYLRSEFGLQRDDPIFPNMSPEDAQGLHALINDPAWKDFKGTRHDNVADRLFSIHMRECQTWARSHLAEQCPPVADKKAEPGHQVADRECSACHLFGTTSAPSFYQLARQGGWTAEKLSDALTRGHQMSPLALPPDQVRDLATYIEFLRRSADQDMP
jgi:hypothetical protein